MILDRLEHADRYAGLHPGFAEAFAFLRRAQLRPPAPGTHEIDGQRVYALVVQAAGRSRDAARLEAHCNYIDIQFVLAGMEQTGWKSRSLCTRREAAYDPQTDIEFFSDLPEAWIPVGPGAFAVFFPEDAHAPMVADGQLQKIVVKVAA